MVNKVVISKIDAISAIRRDNPSPKNLDKFSDRALKRIYCSLEYDNFTTYVQKKEWVIDLNDYLYPPYVECEYVL